MPKHLTEFGYEDPVEKQGKWRFIWPRVRENDPYWWDPPISDGRLGKAGVDFQYKPEAYYREKPGVSDKQWRDDLYFSSPNVKRIYDNWKISKEHPGFTTMPYLYGPEAPLYAFGNITVFPNYLTGLIGKYVPLLTWSFYDGPFGTNCHKKTFVPARTMLYIASAAWMFNVSYYNPVDSFRQAIKTYPGFVGVPIMAAAVWGGLSCFACQYRKKDDWKNMAISGVGVALVCSRKYSLMRSATYGLIVGATTSLWRVLLDYEFGVSGLGGPMKQFGFREPLSWKWMTMETKWSDVPPRNW